jgi:hypothetical protein
MGTESQREVMERHHQAAAEGARSGNKNAPRGEWRFLRIPNAKLFGGLRVGVVAGGAIDAHRPERLGARVVAIPRGHQPEQADDSDDERKRRPSHPMASTVSHPSVVFGGQPARLHGELCTPSTVGGGSGLSARPCTLRIKGRRDGEARRSPGRAHAIRPRRCSDADRSRMRRSTVRNTASTRRARPA